MRRLLCRLRGHFYTKHWCADCWAFYQRCLFCGDHRMEEPLRSLVCADHQPSPARRVVPAVASPPLFSVGEQLPLPFSPTISGDRGRRTRTPIDSVSRRGSHGAGYRASTAVLPRSSEDRSRLAYSFLADAEPAAQPVDDEGVWSQDSGGPRPMPPSAPSGDGLRDRIRVLQQLIADGYADDQDHDALVGEPVDLGSRILAGDKLVMVFHEDDPRDVQDEAAPLGGPARARHLPDGAHVRSLPRSGPGLR